MDGRPKCGSGAGMAMVWLFVSVLAFSGCGPSSDVPSAPQTSPPAVEQLPPEQPAETPPKAVTRPAPVSASGFAPVRIEILPLTELVDSPDGQGGAQVEVYLTALDAFGSQMKAPGKMRFELYEYVQRSAAPKGQRLAIWPDFDLTDPVENHRYWRDFLRAYEFKLRTDVSRSKTYVLEATYLRSSGRLSAEWLLKPSSQ